MKTYYQLNIGARKEQQDSCDIFKNQYSTLIALGDGMGGHKGGAVASQTLVAEAKKAFISQKTKILNPKEFFQTIINATSDSLQEYKNSHHDSDPRTTAVLVLIEDDKLYVAHIGDSRLYLYDENGLLFRTKDHSVVQMLFNMGEITEDEMATHPEQNKLLKSVSASKNVEVSYKEIDIDKNCLFFVLACSDGFWEYVKDNEMQALLSCKNLEKELEHLVSLAKTRGGSGGDNISVAVYLNDTKKESVSQKIKNFLNKEIF